MQKRHQEIKNQSLSTGAEASKDSSTPTHQERNKADQAHGEAVKDMEKDVDFSAQSPNEDLDEGESARLGDDLSAII